MEHEICKLPWFIKYIPVSDRPVAIMNKLYVEGARYVCTDYTSFEAHFTPEVMWALEEPIYKYMTKNLDATTRDTFLGIWKNVVCGTNSISVGNSFRATIEGVRMSGEMNTSLGNGWCNLVLFLYALYSNGASWDDIFEGCPGFVEGDDGIFRVPDHLAPTTEQMEKLGFCLKIDTVDDIAEASFCGQVFEPADMVVVTDPIEVLMKLSWLPRRYVGCSPATALELLKAKAQSALFLYNGCPIITVACVRILDLLKEVKFTKKSYNFFDTYHKQAFRDSHGTIAREIPTATRELVARRYGISIDMQSVIESKLKSVELYEPYFLDLPASYDHYTRCTDSYVNFPVDPNPAARAHYYNFLESVYDKVGTKLPEYMSV